MMHCDLRVRWKVASDLRFRAAISEPKTTSFCRISSHSAPSTRKSLAIAIVRFWCAKLGDEGRAGTRKPKGPKIQKVQDLPLALNFSGESEHFKRAAQQGLVFVMDLRRSRLKFSSEIFLWALR